MTARQNEAPIAKLDLISALSARPLIAILRSPDASRFAKASELLYEAGFRCVEFTLTTAGTFDALAIVRRSLPDDLILGIGTVRSVDQVHQAVDTGADFLVSQVYRAHLLDAARERGLPFVPGALTPTEILNVWDAGVPAVKVSPIGPLGGLDYFDQLRGPLPEVPLVPTGGVEIQEVRAYLQRGAAAVGLSGPLTGDALKPGGDWSDFAQRAIRAVSALDT
jgi:2-dehydro-3-deoxyphosphogluconate aldolase / (4S)-4-hydroxy-2-oxoglutarate aldolase